MSVNARNVVVLDEETVLSGGDGVQELGQSLLLEELLGQVLEVALGQGNAGSHGKPHITCQTVA